MMYHTITSGASSTVYSNGSLIPGMLATISPIRAASLRLRPVTKTGQRQFEFAGFRWLKNAGKQRRGNVLKLGLCLLKKGIDNVLLWLHVFPALLEAVAFAFDVDDGAVMKPRIAEAAKTSFHWEKILLEVKTVETFSYRLAIS